MAKKTFKCPYTGREQRVEFSADLKRPGWHASGGFDPEIPFFTKEAGEAAFRRRDGVDGALSLPVCAYTGAPVAFEKRGVLWFAVGEFFRPMRPTMERAELEAGMASRPGRPAKRPRGRPRVVVGEESSERSDPTAGVGMPLSHAMEMVEGVVR